MHVTPTKEPEVVIDVENGDIDVENSGLFRVEQQKDTSKILTRPVKKRNRSSAKSKSVWRERQRLGVLPVPLALPKKYPADVIMALNRQSMNRVELTRLISQVAKVIFPLKAYPSREELTEVATQLITEYPFIQSTVGVSSVRISYAFDIHVHLYVVSQVEENVGTHEMKTPFLFLKDSAGTQSKYCILGIECKVLKNYDTYMYPNS